MRTLDVAGTVLGYVLMAIFVIATTAVNLYVLGRYGLFVWLFVIPLTIMLIGLVYSLGMVAVIGFGVGIAKAVGALFGVGRNARQE